jgi:hypothetical protein
MRSGVEGGRRGAPGVPQQHDLVQPELAPHGFDAFDVVIA